MSFCVYVKASRSEGRFGFPAALSSRQLAELEELKTRPSQTALLRQREVLVNLTDDWDAIAPETRRALVASVFDWVRPTDSGGLQAQIRPGWIDYAANALDVTVCRLSRPRGSWPG